MLLCKFRTYRCLRQQKNLMKKSTTNNSWKRTSRCAQCKQEANIIFLNQWNGKCSLQEVGRGIIGRLPEKIAKYLKLVFLKNCTGHPFKRTSATLLANIRVDILGLKRHGDGNLLRKLKDRRFFTKWNKIC